MRRYFNLDFVDSGQSICLEEIVISDQIVYSNLDWYIDLHPFITQIDNQLLEFEKAYSTLIHHFKLKSLKSFGCENIELGICAGGALVEHLKVNLNNPLKHLYKLTPVINEGFMQIDSFSLKNLEIFQSFSNLDKHGTLIDCIDETMTSGGGRLLKNNLVKPLTKKKEIVERLDVVEQFFQNPILLNSIQKSLSKVSDLQRILGKVNRSKASPRDIFDVASTLELIPTWKKSLNSLSNHNCYKISKSFSDTGFKNLSP